MVTGYALLLGHVLESVTPLFGGKRTSDIVRLSHEEQVWKDNESDRQLIDYQRYAFGVGDSFGMQD